MYLSLTAMLHCLAVKGAMGYRNALLPTLLLTQLWSTCLPSSGHANRFSTAVTPQDNDVQDEFAPTATSRLVRYLMAKHNKFAHPDGTVSLTYNVQFGQLLDVKEVEQSISLILYIEERWTDPSLSWDPNRFGNLTEVWLPTSEIWLPDIIVTNVADVQYIMQDVRLAAYISSGGEVTYAFPIKNDITCSINIDFFPFDKQKCYLSVNTWTYSMAKLNITPTDREILDLYQINSEWGFEFREIEIIHTTYWGLPWKNMCYHFTIHRRPLFYIFCLFLPSGLITFVSVIGLFAPSKSSGEREEKVTMGITTMLTMAIFLMMVAEQMPKTSLVIPLIGIYFMFQIFIITFATLTTTLIMSIHKRAATHHPPPGLLKWIFITTPERFKAAFLSKTASLAGRDGARGKSQFGHSNGISVIQTNGLNNLEDELRACWQKANQVITSSDNDHNAASPVLYKNKINNAEHQSLVGSRIACGELQTQLESLISAVRAALQALQQSKEREPAAMNNNYARNGAGPNSELSSASSGSDEWIEIASAMDKLAATISLMIMLTFGGCMYIYVNLII